MKLLLDTHIILWALDDNPKLPLEARTFIMDEKNDIYYSTASGWETAIKYMSRPDKIWIGGGRSCLNYAGKWDIGCCRSRTGM